MDKSRKLVILCYIRATCSWRFKFLDIYVNHQFNQNREENEEKKGILFVVVLFICYCHLFTCQRYWPLESRWTEVERKLRCLFHTLLNLIFDISWVYKLIYYMYLFFCHILCGGISFKHIENDFSSYCRLSFLLIIHFYI